MRSMGFFWEDFCLIVIFHDTRMVISNNKEIHEKSKISFKLQFTTIPSYLLPPRSIKVESTLLYVLRYIYHVGDTTETYPVWVQHIAESLGQEG